MKVYFDDESDTADGWFLVCWPVLAITQLRTGMVEAISYDHDLGDDDRGTSYDVLKRIEERVVTADFVPPEVRVRSANAPALTKMEPGIHSIKRLAKR